MKKEKRPLSDQEKKRLIQIIIVVVVTLLILTGIAIGGHLIEMKYFR